MTRLTLHEAAAASGLSYDQVYRRVVTRRQVPGQLRDGRWTIAESDVPLLRPRAPAEVDDRPGINVKVSHEEWALWERLAGPGRTVTQWLLELARAVAGDGRR